jgi:hypothetical protein
MQINSKTIIQEIFRDALNYGIVNTQKDFSRLAGRNAHWYAWVKSNDYDPSTESVLTLANSLQEIGDQNKSRIIKKTIKGDVQKLYGILATRTAVNQC